MNFALHTRFAHVGRPSTNGGLFPIFKRSNKRTSKVASRALFRKELPVELSLTPAEVDEARAQEQAEEDARYDAAEARAEAKHRANQKYLERLGEGARVWESYNPHRFERTTCTTVWELREVVYDYNEYDFDAHWWQIVRASVGINHVAQTWEVIYGPVREACQVTTFPLAHHSLEQMQALVFATLALDH